MHALPLFPWAPINYKNRCNQCKWSLAQTDTCARVYYPLHFLNVAKRVAAFTDAIVASWQNFAQTVDICLPFSWTLQRREADERRTLDERPLLSAEDSGGQRRFAYESMYSTHTGNNVEMLTIVSCCQRLLNEPWVSIFSGRFLVMWFHCRWERNWTVTNVLKMASSQGQSGHCVWSYIFWLLCVKNVHPFIFNLL